jgi:hypothetical protein
MRGGEQGKTRSWGWEGGMVISLYPRVYPTSLSRKKSPVVVSLKGKMICRGWGLERERGDGVEMKGGSR